MMRHSSLDMTNRYTHPRMHDMEGAVAALPSLCPRPLTPESVAVTGMDGQRISNRFAHNLPTEADANAGICRILARSQD